MKTQIMFSLIGLMFVATTTLAQEKPNYKHLKTSIVINAPAEKVWAVLMDFAKYPEWNPFIRKIEGSQTVGEHLDAYIYPAEKANHFRPRILQNQPNRIFEWKGKLLFGGLFDGQHKFELVPQADGSTLFIQSEKFTGILVPMGRKMLENDTPKAFNAMNLALKNKVEGSLARK